MSSWPERRHRALHLLNPMTRLVAFLQKAYHRLAAPLHTMVVRGLDMITAILAVVLVARNLGTEGMGTFILAFNIAGILSITMLFGSDGIAVRMYAASEHEPRKVMGAALSILVAGSVICFASAAIISAALSLTGTQALVVALAVITLMLNSLAAVFAHAIIAYDNSRYDIAAMILSRIVLVGGLILGLKFGGLLDAMWAYVISSALLAGARAFIVHRTCFRLRPIFDRGVLRTMWSAGWKVGLGSVFGTISSRSDALLLQALATTQVVGIYGAAYRIVNGVSAGIVAVAESLFPRIVRAHSQGQKTLEIRLFIVIPVLIGVLALIGSIFFSQGIIDFLYGKEFEAAGVVLQLLFIVIALDTIAAFYSRYLVATHREKLLPKAQGIGAVVNITLNICLIPRFGAWGAALAIVISCASCLIFYAIVALRNRVHRRLVKSPAPLLYASDPR